MSALIGCDGVQPQLVLSFSPSLCTHGSIFLTSKQNLLVTVYDPERPQNQAPYANMRNVIILGGSYSGARAAGLLSQTLPITHRVILIDRQSHFNHLYLFPRVGVVPNHANKVFIPYTGVMASPGRLSSSAPSSKSSSSSTEGTESSRSGDSSGEGGPTRVQPVFVRASVTDVGPGFVEIDRDLDEETLGASGSDDVDIISSGREERRRRRLNWDYLIYALGSTLPAPLLSPARTKVEGVRFLQAQQDRIALSKSVLIVGGGALGIQYATDIADLYNNPANAALRPENSVEGKKKITLVHSRSRFLPLYKQEVHDEVTRRLDELGVDVIMGERLALPEWVDDVSKQPLTSRRIETKTGVLEYDLLLRCTGQKPNSQLLKKSFPDAINSQGYVEVRPTLQLDSCNTKYADRMYVIGDVANTHAIRAGHIGWNQAGIVVQNIMSSILCGHREPSLISYEPSPPQIKVTLGLRNSVSELLPSIDASETQVKMHSDGAVDAGWVHTWARMGVDAQDPTI
ncbi:BZ3500_MvSof-1268-A1-R1_Chr1-2g01287 [Microbotryum saponariae]|uniref:BZ3500_MvSof-1268-A1-R1_Chr1-2g01287 protein n=1 Tax=Microbotryum saponariae TaxID=289078 RepID=A0A2X0LLC2_9BASI|nr:BZ3500_MvSof-1268-A1-R1_Chr1-2g01287 [Microbotryum saponariae]SCZ96983.1 BZ3501_MvSof-1269-A2-R1_Chr1-2g00885 [Microbotryum saponariae]